MRENPDTNPDTHPDEWELLDKSLPIQDGDIFKDSWAGWKNTIRAGQEGHGIYTYYRRTTKEKTMTTAKWKPIEDGPPPYNHTILLSLNPSRVRGEAAQGWLGWNSAMDKGKWSQGGPNSGMKTATHWLEITDEVEPSKTRPIVIITDGTPRQVECLADGSVKVGCTTVDSTTFDKIVECRRKKVAGK